VHPGYLIEKKKSKKLHKCGKFISRIIDPVTNFWKKNYVQGAQT